MDKQSSSEFNANKVRSGGPVLIDGSSDLIELESDESLDDTHFFVRDKSDDDIVAGSSREKLLQHKLNTSAKIKIINNKLTEDDYDDHIDETTRLHVNTTACHQIADSPSMAQLSVSSSSLSDPLAPMCKICHISAKDNDPLISPCKCSGTMQYMHCGCLMKWLEITSKKSRKPLSCELCQYQYQWHKKFKVSHWQFPHCSRSDKLLHLLFFVSLTVMLGCAVVTVMCFKQEKGQRIDPNHNELSQSEVVTLVCGVLFFLAFFMAMYVEVKARNTIYKLVMKFIYLNQQWYIDEYDNKKQSLQQPVSV